LIKIFSSLEKAICRRD